MAELSQEQFDQLITALNKRAESDSAAAAESSSRLGKLGEAAGKSTGDMLKFGGSLFSSSARVSTAFDTAGSVATNFSGVLGSTAQDFTKAITGGGLALVKAAESGVDTFRTLSTSGAAFNNDILLLKNSAAQSRLTLDEFAGVVSNNTQGFAAFGGTVTKGARLFTDASQAMFDQGLSTPLLNMGMTFEEVNEDLAEYIVRNRRRFTEEEIRNGTAAANMVKMSTEMDKIAKITGQNRKELEKEVNDRARKGQVEAKIRMLEASGNKEAADKMKLALAEAAKAGPGALAAVEDLFTKGAVVSEEGRAAAVALGPAFNDLTNMVNVAKGPGGIDGMNTSIANFNGAISERISDPNFLQIATIGGMGNQFADAAAGLVETAGTYSDNVQKLIDEGKTREQAIKILDEQAKTEQKSREGVTSTVINGEKALRDLGAIINDKLIGENGALQGFSDKLLTVGDKLEAMNRSSMEAPIDTAIKNAEAAMNTFNDVVTGNASVNAGPGPDPSSISASSATIADMKKMLASMEGTPNMQKTDASALASALGTSIGPQLAEAIKANADYYGRTVEEQIKMLVTTGKSDEVVDMAKKIFAKQNPNLDADMFANSLRNSVNVPLEELLKKSNLVIDQMTVTNMNVPGREFGGPVKKDQAYVVGEKRAELFVPDQSGYVVPSIKNLVSKQKNSVDTAGLEATMREFASNMQNAIQGSGVQNQMQDLAEQLNNSMAPVVGELMKGNRVAAKQLKGIGGLSGNLFKSIG